MGPLMMTLTMIGFVVVFVFGMCVGQAISKQDAAPFLSRAQRAEDQVAQMEAQRGASARTPEVTQMGADRASPVTVHVHLPHTPPTWSQLPVFDALPAPSPIDLDALTETERRAG